MRHRGFLYLALTMGFAGIATAVLFTAQADPMTIREDGLQFPDGTVQTTAAADPDKRTHIWRDPGDHVLLNFFGDPSGVCPSIGGGPYKFRRIFPDATVADFAIPPEHLLVITDFNVTAARSPSYPAGAALQLILRPTNVTTNTGEIGYRTSYQFPVDMTSNNHTLTGDMRAGIVLAAGTMLCPSFSLTDDSGTGGAFATSGNFRGYLIDLRDRASP